MPKAIVTEPSAPSSKGACAYWYPTLWCNRFQKPPYPHKHCKTVFSKIFSLERVFKRMRFRWQFSSNTCGRYAKPVQNLYIRFQTKTDTFGRSPLFSLFLLFRVLFQTPIIPPTISDQIRLWELERSRMTFTEGSLCALCFLYLDFAINWSWITTRFYVLFRMKLSGYISSNITPQTKLKT